MNQREMHRDGPIDFGSHLNRPQLVRHGHHRACQIRQVFHVLHQMMAVSAFASIAVTKISPAPYDELGPSH